MHARYLTLYAFARSIFVAGEGRIDVIDDGKLEKVGEIPAGVPFSVATQSGPSRDSYVGDVKTGTLSRSSCGSTK